MDFVSNSFSREKNPEMRSPETISSSVFFAHFGCKIERPPCKNNPLNYFKLFSVISGLFVTFPYHSLDKLKVVTELHN
jgi:hypothetical protein